MSAMRPFYVYEQILGKHMLNSEVATIDTQLSLWAFNYACSHFPCPDEPRNSLRSFDWWVRIHDRLLSETEDHYRLAFGSRPELKDFLSNNLRRCCEERFFCDTRVLLSPAREIKQRDGISTVVVGVESSRSNTDEAILDTAFKIVCRIGIAYRGELMRLLRTTSTHTYFFSKPTTPLNPLFAPPPNPLTSRL